MLALKAPTCVVQMHVGGDVEARCVFGHRHALTFRICLRTTEKGGGRHYHSIKLFLRCLPELYFNFENNIKCTSATVHRAGSLLLLFLHIPDIIIAVQVIIICLLWKLADCLSPVPEELLLAGVSLEKHHRSGLSHA